MLKDNLFVTVDNECHDLDTIYRYLRVFRELKILGDPEYGKIVAEINSKNPDTCRLSMVLSNLIYELRVRTSKEDPYSPLELLDIKYPNKNIDRFIIMNINERIKYLINYLPKFKYVRDVSGYLRTSKFYKDSILYCISGEIPSSLILYLHERAILRKSENK